MIRSEAAYDPETIALLNDDKPGLASRHPPAPVGHYGKPLRDNI